MFDPGRGARCAIRDTGAPGPDRYHWTVALFGETAPITAGRAGGLGEAHAEGRYSPYVEGRDWPSGGGIGDNGWLRSSGACRHAMIEKKPGDHFSSSSSDFASFRSGVSNPSVNHP